MKRLLIVCLVFALGSSFTTAQQELENPTHVQSVVLSAAIEWDATSYDFGVITQGEPVSHRFEFTNVGDKSIIISDVKASCGCTATAYTQEEVAPGETGFVEATYNAAKKGVFVKTLTVLTNDESSSWVLKFHGEVAAD